MLPALACTLVSGLRSRHQRTGRRGLGDQPPWARAKSTRGPGGLRHSERSPFLSGWLTRQDAPQGHRRCSPARL